MSIDSHADFYLDFQRFSDLRLNAREDSQAAAQTVAQQFEGLFVQQMLAAMRSAAKVDGVEQSSYMDFYREMYDKQLAQTIAGQDRLGVAGLIMRQMPGGAEIPAAPQPPQLPSPPGFGAADGGTRAAGGTAAAVPAPHPQPSATAGAAPPAAAEAASAAAARGSENPVQAAGVVLGRVVDDDFAEAAKIEAANPSWEQPQQFVADLLPEARRAAGSLGVSPELLIAQAALETGWGRHTMKFEDGRSSYNLFGIKAGADWRGSALNRASLEYIDGALESRVSRFRAYASPADSLADYVDFIRSSPRYGAALSQAGDDLAYIRAIHEAGYATDPSYADKVIGILNGDLLQRTLAGPNPGATDHA